MSAESVVGDALSRLVDDFIERCRRGETPAVEDYVKLLPESADEIRATFPMLAMIESAARRGRDSSPVPTNSALLERIGDYRIVREIGRGGMGVVYEAVQESLGRKVAVKVLPSNLLVDRSRLDRFHREAQASAQLRHPNIIPVHGVGEQDGIAYFVMAFVDGMSLDRVIELLRSVVGGGSEVEDSVPWGAVSPLVSEYRRWGPVAQSASALSWIRSPVRFASSLALARFDSRKNHAKDHARYHERIASIIARVADALAYAHEHGVLHRDVKPSNLLLDREGEVWLADFGLAKTGDSEALTHTGDVVGTLRYVAPERLRGEMDARSDVYSLGLTLFELLTLRSAFEDVDRVRLLRRIGEEEPPSPRSLEPRIPRDLDTIVRKSIAKEPGRRYSSARELERDLARFLEGRTIAARQSTNLEKLGVWVRRNPLVASLSVVVFGLLLVVAIGSTLSALWLVNENQRANQSQRRAEVAERAARDKLFESYVGQAKIGRSTGRVGQRLGGLEAIARAVSLASDRGDLDFHAKELRRQAIACLALPDLEMDDATSAELFPSACHDVVADSALQFVAGLDQEGNLRMVSTKRLGRETVHPIPGTDTASCALLAMSNDGSRLVLSGGKGGSAWNRLMDVGSGRAVEPSFTPAGGPWLVACFSPDSSRLAFAADENLQVVELSTGHVAKQRSLGPVQALAWSPSGESLASASRIELEVWSADLKERRSTFTYRTSVRSLAWSGDGARLVVGCDDEAVVQSAWKGGWERAFRRHGGPVHRVAFVPESPWIASTGADDITRIWDSISCREVLAIDGRLGGVGASGRRLLLMDRAGRARIGQLVGGKERLSMLDPLDADSVQSLAFVGGPGLLALADRGGLRFVNIGEASRAKRAPIGMVGELGSDHAGNTLFAFGSTGLSRWPIQCDAKAIRIGPSRTIFDLPSAGAGFDATPDGLRLVVADPAGRILVFDSQSDSLLFEGAHPGVRHVAIDPRGRWVASSASMGAPNVLLWDLEKRGSRTLVSEGPARLAFDSNGSWLAGSLRDRLVLWDTVTWEIRSQHQREESIDSPPLALSPDSRYLATASRRDAILLLRVHTSEELGLLESPTSQQIESLAFDRAGCLLASGFSDGTAEVWDLPLVQRQLRELGLAWDADPTSSHEPISVREIAVDLGALTNHPRVHQRNSANLRTLLERITRQLDQRGGVRSLTTE